MSAPKRPRKEIEFWIAKVPAFVLEEWDRQADLDNDEPIGHLVPMNGGSDDGILPSVFSLASASPSGPNVELVVRPDYLPNSNIIPPSLFVVSDDPSSEVCTLEGRAALFADIRPSLSPGYEAIIAERNAARDSAEVQTERMGMGDHKRMGTPQMTVRTGSTAAAMASASRPGFRKSKAERVVDKRVRLDEKSLRNRLFHIFDAKPHYRLAELVDLTQQPKTFLKEILAQICIQHRSGPNMHMYSLLPNYALTTDEPEDDGDVDMKS